MYLFVSMFQRRRTNPKFYSVSVDVSEVGASQNEIVFADPGHPMWILRSVVGASVNNVNRKTRALEKDDSQRTSSPEPKRARIGSSS